jgi:hypothetical protein
MFPLVDGRGFIPVGENNFVKKKSLSGSINAKAGKLPEKQ